MVSVRKVTAEDFEEIYSSLLTQFRNPELTREDYRRLFTYQWDSAEDWYGYALIDGGLIVGFVGLIFSQRLVRGVYRRFCNISHWIVQPAYRGPHGLSLLLHTLRLPGCTLTTFTPTKAITPLYLKLKWTELDHRCHIILAMPYLGLPRCHGRLIFEPAQIQSRLESEEARIFHDHQPYRCGHLYIEVAGVGCYVVFTRVLRKRMPFVLVHYIGNASVFVQNIGRIRSTLCFRQRAIGLLVDERFLEGNRVFATLVHEGEQRFFFTTSKAAGEDAITRTDVDSLYSEYILTKV